MLPELDLTDEPLALFRRWYDEMERSGQVEPAAMTLATADADGRPSARVVLLKGADATGLRFVTNYESRKSRELTVNPHAALVFSWPALRRQVRVEGEVERAQAEWSDAYFAARGRGSQLGAWASEQSSVLPDRDVLEARRAAVEREYADRPLPRPPHWGGMVLRPHAWEFWSGRPDRLHDRFRYRRAAGGDGWVVQRLAP